MVGVLFFFEGGGGGVGWQGRELKTKLIWNNNISFYHAIISSLYKGHKFFFFSFFSFFFVSQMIEEGGFPLPEVWKSDQTLNFISKGKLSVILLHFQNLHFFLSVIKRGIGSA